MINYKKKSQKVFYSQYYLTVFNKVSSVFLFSLYITRQKRNLTVERWSLLIDLQHFWKSQTHTNICDLKLIKYSFLSIMVNNFGT